MGTLRPIGEATPVVFTFRAHSSAEFIAEVIDEQGVKPAEQWEVTFDLKDVESADLRRRLRQAYARYDAIEFYPVLPGPAEDPAPFLEALEPWLDAVEKEKTEEELAVAEAAEEDRVKTEAFLAEMKRWVAEHGSLRLQIATERDYRTTTSYAFERSKQEMPGFWVDSAEDCEWGERVDPTEEALLLEQVVKSRLEEVDPSLEIRIVWLTETPRALDRKLEAEGLGFAAQEALIVPGYLGRYLLAMPLETLLRRDPDQDY